MARPAARLMSRYDAQIIAEQLTPIIEQIVQNVVSKVIKDTQIAEENYLSYKEASQITGYSINTLKHNIKNIPHLKVGPRKVLFKETDLRKWLERDKWNYTD